MSLVGFRHVTLLALAMLGCSSSFAAAGPELDAGGDVAGDHEDLDAGGRDVAGDHEDLDVAGDACSPLVAPLPLPSSCQCEAPSQCPAGAGSIGCVWIVGSNSTCSAGCWSYAVPGSASCEACRETYTCACLASELAAAGLSACSCVDTPRGPHLEGCP